MSSVVSNPDPKETAKELDLAAIHMDALSFIREAQVNAEEAKATYIEWGFVWVKVGGGKWVPKLTIADNGVGMNASDLCGYMGTLRKNGSMLLLDEALELLEQNYGGGLKWSSLGINKAGFLVASKTKFSTPNLIRIFRDKDTYELQEFNGSEHLGFDPRRSVIVPGFGEFCLADTIGYIGAGGGSIFDSPSWTVMIFGGNTLEENTVGGSMGGGGTRSNPKDYLDSKFLGSKVETHVVQPRGSVPSLPLVNHRNCDSRMVRGLLNKFEGDDVSSGTINGPDGIRVHWMLDTGINLDNPQRRHGTVSFTRGDEIVEHFTLDSGASEKFRSCGIWAQKAFKAITIVFELPKAGTLESVGAFFNSTTRNTLKWADGSGGPGRSLPYEDFGQIMIQNFPEEIDRFIQGLKKTQEQYDNDYQKFLSDVATQLGLTNTRFFCIQGKKTNEGCYFEPNSKSIGGVRGGGNKPKNKGGKTNNTGNTKAEGNPNQGHEGGPVKGTSRRKRNIGAVEVVVDFDNLVIGEEESHVLMRYVRSDTDQGLGRGYLNPLFKGYKPMITKLIAEDGPQHFADIDTALMQSLKYEATFIINRMLQLMDELELHISDDEAKAYVSDSALTGAVSTSGKVKDRYKKTVATLIGARKNRKVVVAA